MIAPGIQERRQDKERRLLFAKSFANVMLASSKNVIDDLACLPEEDLVWLIDEPEFAAAQKELQVALVTKRISA